LLVLIDSGGTGRFCARQAEEGVPPKATTEILALRARMTRRRMAVVLGRRPVFIAGRLRSERAARDAGV
jgi:hypothetical protein